MTWTLWLACTAGAQMVDATALDERWILDIRYATTDNFTGQKLYPVARCLLRQEVAQKLKGAQSYLDQYHPGHVLMLKDCYRPVSVQKKMWDVVKGTPQQGYVANPYSKTGSVHNYGAAVDLTLADGKGQELDMGTAYDHLGALSQPRYEEKYLNAGKLTQLQVRNRRMLRDAMTKGGGFRMIRNEWWHFDAWQGAALRSRYQKMDIPLEPPAKPTHENQPTP